MGSGSDIHSRNNVIEDVYLSDTHGVERLLASIFEITERSKYKFDQSATTLITDLNLALDSDIFTELERKTIALVYYAQLEYQKVAKLLEVKVHEVISSLAESLEKISAVFLGYKVAKLPKYKPRDYSLMDWLEAVGKGEASVYEIPPQVNTDILNWLAKQGDDQAQETLRQRKEGPPIEEYRQYKVEQYPFYTEEQFRRMDQKLSVSYLPKKELERLALGRTVVGGRKTSFHEDEFDFDTNKGKFGPRVVNAKVYK